MANYTGKNPFQIPRPIRTPGGFNAETLAASKTLTYQDSQFQALDPGGSGRDVALPAAGARKGAFFWIANKANAAEALTLLQPDGSTNVCTIHQNEAAMVFCADDGATAGAAGWTLFALFTIAIV